MKTEDIKKMAQAWKQVQEANCAPKMKKEELKGNQHKIDHNKDGKISAADFKGLRKKAKKDQEVEAQTSEAKIDEISKKTLGSYVKKASSDMANNAYALGARDPLKKPGSWDKAFKRKAGIAKATDKLTKEENELDEAQLDKMKKISPGFDTRSKAELHNDHLVSKKKASHKSYVAKIGDKYHVVDMKEEAEQIDEISKKTLANYVNKASDDRAQNALEIGKSGKMNFKGLKRRQGIQRATKRLAKEEAEQIDELSKKTLGSYVKKASRDVANRSADNARDVAKNGAKLGLNKKTMKNWRREIGIDMAIDKMTKEAKDHGNMNNGSPTGEGLSPSAKDQLAKKTPAPAAFDADLVNKKTFDAMRASAKKATMRTNDNPQGDKTPPKGK